jgi:ADP-heptose:LPS heptosyltransferase
MSDVTDCRDTAERLGNLDALVSVDTAAAHLAGAMGLPTFVLLPHTPDWRWMLSRSDTPWYQSMRLFRQTTPGNWRGLIRALREVLSAQSEP